MNKTSKPAKQGGKRKAESPPAGKDAVTYVRMEPDLVRALDEEAAERSEAAGGIKITRAELARVLLRQALVHRLKR